MSDIPCAFEGCENAASARTRQKYCWGHLKQLQRGVPLTSLRPRGRTPKQVLVEAALALGETSDKVTRGEAHRGAWKAAFDRLAMAARRYVAQRATKS